MQAHRISTSNAVPMETVIHFLFIYLWGNKMKRGDRGNSWGKMVMMQWAFQIALKENTDIKRCHSWVNQLKNMYFRRIWDNEASWLDHVTWVNWCGLKPRIRFKVCRERKYTLINAIIIVMWTLPSEENAQLPGGDRSSMIANVRWAHHGHMFPLCIFLFLTLLSASTNSHSSRKRCIDLSVCSETARFLPDSVHNCVTEVIHTCMFHDAAQAATRDLVCMSQRGPSARACVAMCLILRSKQ